MALVVVKLVSIRAPAQFTPQEYVANALPFECLLQRLLVKLGGVFRVRLRSSVHHNLDGLRLQQSEKVANLMIRVSNRQDSQIRMWRVVHFPRDAFYSKFSTRAGRLFHRV